MKLIIQTPKKSLDKAFLKQPLKRDEIDLFKANLNRLLGKIDEIEREENQKNHVRDFLRDTFYKDTNEINTKDSKDLVIHLGKSNKDKVGVIIEAKRPSNKSEMLTEGKPNVKAFQELVLYYLRERIESNNDEVKNCIITNIYEWYIIDAAYFEKLFSRNKSFVKEYEKWRDKKKVVSDTRHFYEHVVKLFIDNIEEDIPCTYFDLRDYSKILKKTNHDEDANLIALQKILSPYHLLKTPFADDSNKLDDRFYKELLHIIGLEEIKEGNKYVIQRKISGKNTASLIEQVKEQLSTVGLHKIVELKNFGNSLPAQLFSVSLELCITWVNRILFLKLLEGQLLKYHNGNDEYCFLNKETVADFAELYKLFHKVLAVKNEERSNAIKDKYMRIPYLNSSLFEISPLEEATITINALDSSLELELIGSTILRDQKKKKNKLPTLEYLFKFLNAYNFSSEGKEEIRDDKSRGLINASVLGKVFEKINGYKDGSVFTPGAITMYMSRQAVRLAVVQKFNNAYNWNVKSFAELKNYLADHRSVNDILYFNKLINSLRICDPAVGSGHFLVSVLNEIIQTKAELGLLADDAGIRFPQYEFTIANDELIVTDLQGNIFQYEIINGKPSQKEVQRLQRALFYEKQTIIENCLFGVDINSNSAKICSLRLWIELLKNAYYKEESLSDLETLPNIDINIKCGNSLLSKFSTDDKLTEAFRKPQFDLKSYKLAVRTYKNATDKNQKLQLLDLIDKIKKEYTRVIGNTDPKRRKIADLKAKILLVRHNIDLFGKRMSDEDAQWEERRLSIQLEKQLKEIDDIEKARIYYNSFEWRFEFPETLNDDGDFEGFDIIIGNPPYIESRSSAIDERIKDEILAKISERRKKDATLITRGSDILIYFIELGLSLIKPDGYFSFITQNSWLDTDYGFKFQKFLRRNTEIIGVFDNAIRYFDESANINTIITLFKGNKGVDTNKINFVRFDVGFEQAPYEPNELNSIRTAGRVNNLRQDASILDSIKWGIILNSDELIIDLHKRLFENSSRIGADYRIGQGLNLTKDYVVSKKDAQKFKLPTENLVPFFTNADGAPFSISNTENYLITGKGLDNRQCELITENNIKIVELNWSTRKIPSLILPRGVGRHFCAVNPIGAYSSSYVEIYLTKNEQEQDYKKFLWLFLNSSIGWLIREISGRKNLGGGMLKAEAIDLKNYPLLFNFSTDMTDINRLYRSLGQRQAENCIEELTTTEHMEIDNIVFKKFGYTDIDKKGIIEKLSQLIEMRINKSKTKI